MIYELVIQFAENRKASHLIKDTDLIALSLFETDWLEDHGGRIVRHGEGVKQYFDQRSIVLSGNPKQILEFLKRQPDLMPKRPMVAEDPESGDPA